MPLPLILRMAAAACSAAELAAEAVSASAAAERLGSALEVLGVRLQRCSSAQPP